MRKPTYVLSFAFAVLIAVSSPGQRLALEQKNPPWPPADAASPLLVCDVAPELRSTLPRNFRTTDDPLKAKDGTLPSTTGLAELRASGGAEFTATSLKLMLPRLRGPVTIFDLRQETHGFADGLPISWMATNNWANVGRAHEAIEADEVARLLAFKPGTTLALADEKIIKGEAGVAPPEPITVTHPATERAVVEAAGAAYVRLTVTDHARPLDAEVDRFILAIRALPPGGWAHFHCRAGKGRTTTFMALYDMLRNAREVSLEDIARRQELLGNDYDVLRPAEAGSWKVPITEDRIAFVRAFYDYARANPDGRSRLWSEWLKNPPGKMESQ